MNNNEVAVVPKKEELQKQLKTTLRGIDKKLRTLGHNTIDDPFQTGGNFKYNELDSNTVQILTCTGLDYLGKALAKMKRVKLDYEDTMTELGIKEYPVCTWFQNSIDKWIHDLTIRIKIVSNQAIITALQQSKTELEQYLSQDEKLFNTLQRVSELAKK